MQDKGSSVPLASHMEVLQKAATQQRMAQWRTWEKKAVLTATLVSAYLAPSAETTASVFLCIITAPKLELLALGCHDADNAVILLSMVICVACQCLGSEDEEQDADKAGDLLAANLGITHFSLMLRRAYKQEQEDVLGQAKRPK